MKIGKSLEVSPSPYSLGKEVPHDSRNSTFVLCKLDHDIHSSFLLDTPLVFLIPLVLSQVALRLPPSKSDDVDYVEVPPRTPQPECVALPNTPIKKQTKRKNPPSLGRATKTLRK